MSKIVNEYAVDPKALKDYQSFRYIFEKFGFSQGRLIVRIPQGWEREVVALCSDPVEKQKIVERLRLHGQKRVVAAVPTGSERPADWIGQVSAVHRREPLAGAVLEREISTQALLPPLVAVADCDESFLPEVRETNIRRTAEEIAEITRVLFRHSPRVVIVDPYFNPLRRGFRETLEKFIVMARQERCDFIDVVFPARSLETNSVQQELARRIPTLHGNNKRLPRLKFFVLSDGSSRADFHHRFLLSEFGAIRFDAGVAADGDELWGDVILVGRERHAALVEQYMKIPDTETGVATWSWPSGYR